MRRLNEAARRTARDRFPIARLGSGRDTALRHIAGLAAIRQEHT
jgi:hypothetical protein